LRSFLAFFCREVRLAIEVDGSIHRYKEEEDLKRQHCMERYDVTFIRFTNEEIKKDISNVLWRLQETVEELLQRKDIPPSPPPPPPEKGGKHAPPAPPPWGGGAHRAGDVPRKR